MKDFDELLDRVLREDAAVQPRAGLEGRVVARVWEEERLPQGFILRLRRGWRSWLLVPAACAGTVAVVWYVAAGGASHSERIALRGSSPSFSAHPVAKPEMGSGESGRALRDAHLSDDKAVAKMGHPVLESARYGGREIKRANAAPVDEPKLETFPAVSQKGDVVGWLGRDDGGKLAVIAREVSPETLEAYQQLRAAQNEPLDIAAIEIKPLQ